VAEHQLLVKRKEYVLADHVQLVICPMELFVTRCLTLATANKRNKHAEVEIAGRCRNRQVLSAATQQTFAKKMEYATAVLSPVLRKQTNPITKSVMQAALVSIVFATRD